MMHIGLIASFVCAYVGFSCWAISQTQHWRTVIGGPFPNQGTVRAQRFIGIFMVALSLILAVFNDGFSFGALVWVLILSLAATLVAFSLVWCPRLLGYINKVISYFYFDNTVEKTNKP
ncbi:DUF3325 domain-containing protein [Pseudoalteromonas sp. SR44-5]|uniref:DUF3325 family protein n=1 Tax=Pseudoalteromonas TaxID=53246 RepID=UPI001603C893|nr:MULTISPECIES: DUF3325 family protein [unclassified Pseudoalteromonas]MBB1335607.1 DUF3325 domain-containing protein [Pseudoalteromonas sp. SR41-6]MBB1342516.1 DUF3325 domain-containing protein [Pseudoalteromonas sp. SR45-6]MBB1369046.1 DUF3325 domain-containing protein [Pseudoalteromonas sp. SR44-5]MBB1419610.1 DUF3325 domain-containing protein [Pseudoalteromonas sp. SG44-1]MBB1422983.1 DUF3325 domain-containing protein [Pseudoalteromonas sp. SG43-7]